MEYQREAYDMFLALLAAINEETVGYVFHLELPSLTELETAQAVEAAEVDAVAGANPVDGEDAGRLQA